MIILLDFKGWRQSVLKGLMCNQQLPQINKQTFSTFPPAKHLPTASKITQFSEMLKQLLLTYWVQNEPPWALAGFEHKSPNWNNISKVLLWHKNMFFFQCTCILKFGIVPEICLLLWSRIPWISRPDQPSPKCLLYINLSATEPKCLI